MFLMLPTERITKIIQCWFARALCLYGQGLEIYAFIFLSNHAHFLVNDTGGTLAAFMWYFQGNVAKAINKELGRKGKFWSREYDDVIVTNDEAFMNRYAYTVGNAVKSGLVDKSEEWLGWSSLAGALSDGKYCFEMLNKTKLHNATRRGQKVDESKFVDEWRFELTIPPMLRNKSDKERQQFIHDLMEVAEADFRKARENKPPLGAKNILQQRPTDRPRNPSFRPRIKVFCLDKQERFDWLEGYRSFVGSYREVFDGFRKAAAKRKRPTVEWPEGSYPPACWYPVGQEIAS
jgi:hypothetical protein